MPARIEDRCAERVDAGDGLPDRPRQAVPPRFDDRFLDLPACHVRRATGSSALARHVLEDQPLVRERILLGATATETFGVTVVPSAFEPGEFRPGRTFDFIWVASLFSHLPEELFRRWVAKLVSLPPA